MQNLNSLINLCTNTYKSHLVNVLNNNANLRMFVYFMEFGDGEYIAGFVLTEHDINNVKWSDYDRTNQKWESHCVFTENYLKYFTTDEVLRECQLPKVDEIFIQKFTESDILDCIDEMNTNNLNITESHVHQLVYGYICESMNMYGVSNIFNEQYSSSRDFHLYEIYNDSDKTDHDHFTTVHAIYNWYNKQLVAVVIHQEDGNQNDVYIHDDRFIKGIVGHILSDSDYFIEHTGSITNLDLIQQLGF